MIKIEYDAIREIREGEVLSTDLMAKIAAIYQKAIHTEIRRDQASQRGTKRGPKDPAGLPQDPKFVESFKVLAKGQVLEVTSSWPTAAALLEGRGRYRMKWLTQSRGVKVVPMPGPRATTEFRTTPKTTEGAWIHPGFRRHDFLDRAFEKALDDVAELVIDKLLAKMASKRYL